MSITTLTGRDTLLAAPLEAIPIDPVAQLPETGSEQAHREVKIKLKSSVRAFRGREVESPDTQDLQRVVEDLVEGRIAQAQTLWEGAPTSIVAASRLAHALLMAGRADEAEEIALAAVSLGRGTSTQDSAALFVAARVLASIGEIDSAETALAELPPDGPWSLLFSSLAERRGELDVALARLEGSTTADSLAYRGYLLLRSMKPQPGLRALRAASARSGPSPSLLVNQAFAFALLGSPDKAVRAARQATSLAPRDLTASFNLANYLRTSGRPDLALAELSRLSHEVGSHPLIVSAKADILLQSARIDEALRELRRATHHTDEAEGSSHQAELRANIAVLEWISGKKERKDCLKVVIDEINSSGPQISLASIVADLATEASEVQLVEQWVGQLMQTSTEVDLLPVTSRLAYLRGDYPRAAQLAVEWAESSPLDAHASRAAVFHVGQSLGDYSRAGDLGLTYLRRLPHDQLLINNTAFVLGLAGRQGEAKRVLKRVSEADNVLLAATRGLVAFGEGDIKAGLAGYDHAETLASNNESRSEELQVFLSCLRAQETLVIYQLGLEDSKQIPDERKQFVLPRGWANDLRFRPFAAVAKRVPAPWPAA